MPNPTIANFNSEPAEFRISPENGVLAFVPGDLIAAAMQTLPRAEYGVQSPRTVRIEVPGRGLFSITFEAANYKKAKSVHWFWRLVRADQLNQEPTGQ